MNWVTRLSILLYFCTATLVSSWILREVNEYPLNFFIVATIDAMVAVSLNSFGANSIVRGCQKVAVFQILAHTYGYLLFLADTEFDYNVDYESYSQIQIILIAAQYLRLFWQSKSDENITNDFRLDWLCHTGFSLR